MDSEQKSPKVIERKDYRQELLQYQTYGGKDSTPSYVYHGADDDRLMILCSQIKIWQAEGTDWFNIPAVTDKNCLVIREVSSIEITKSYKDVISTAVISIPRGTVVDKRNKEAVVKAGDKETGTESKNQTVVKATESGDLMTVGSARYLKDGTPTASLAPNYDDKGLVDFNRTEQEVALLEPGDMAIGNRIEIRLGYAYSEEEYELIRTSEGKDVNLDLVFTGFITGISVGTPLQIECENMAHLLTTFSIPKNITDKTPLTVKDFLSNDGKYKLLEGTGLELTESTKQCNIDVRGAQVNSQMSVVDVIDLWRKFGVMSYMQDESDGTSRLRVAKIYYIGNKNSNGSNMPTDDVNYITYNGGNNVYVIIQADWDVADDDLGLMHTDKKYLAVEAEGRNKDGNWIKLTLIKRPDIDDEGWTTDKDGQFYVSNEQEYTPRKKKKRTGGTNNTMVKKQKLSNKISMKRYNVVPYISSKVGITRDELVEEAKQYWNLYVPNGIDGSITLFGDLDIQPAQIVGLVDQRQPEKNGYYLVESVNIEFGTNGYRKKLKLPYKLASFGGPVINII